MPEQAIQLLAALANPSSRTRFAELVLAGEAGLPATPKADRLLLSARCAEESGGRTVIVPSGIREALDGLREAKGKMLETRKLEHLPRRREERLAKLQSLASEAIAGGESIFETTLNARLSEHVVDVALIRRAMVDQGIIERDPATQTYWRVEAVQ